MTQKNEKIKEYLLSNPPSTNNTYGMIGKKFGIEGENVRSIWRRIKPQVNMDKVISPSGGGYDEQNLKNGTREKSVITSKPIKTLEELVNICEIDTDVWNIDKYICNVWADKWQVKAFMSLKKKEEVDYIEEFKKFIEHQSIKVLRDNKVHPVNFYKSIGNTLVINIADIHLGKLVCEEEVGEDYDIKIAVKRFNTTLKEVIVKASGGFLFRKIILCTLGDTIHVDNTKSTTTSGTYVESDTRASKLFSTALEMIVDGIDFCAKFAEEVEFINIPGNHCELSEQHLGIAIKAYYRNNKNIKVDAEPMVRKYRLIGENLVAWAHGDTIQNTLPLAMATEKPEMWGKSKYRLMQLGHLHSSKKRIYQSEDEHNGVMVRHFSSISGTDSWHNKNNFINNNKKATGLIFNDKEIGIVAEFNHTVQ